MKVLFFMFSFMIACSSPTNLSNTSKKSNDEKTKTPIDLTGLKQATFGAGCFWCTEAVFEELRGVEKVISGFAGGHVKNPSYREVTSGTTGHAEVAKIYYNPEQISYETLLEVFWTTHDPTTLNRQGADIGEWYRSVIFYHDDEQKAKAEKSKKEVAPELWSNPIVTEISAISNFTEAENYHQDYYELNPDYGYCVAVINPKMEKFRKKFAGQLKSADTPATKTSGYLPKVLKSGNYNKLSDMESYVLLKQGTERSFSGKYHDNKKEGVYVCRQCNLPLFKSDDKFDSGTGWPSFDDTYEKGNVEERTDSDGRRIEIICGNCKGHLGHVFKNENFTKKNTRHCANSASLRFYQH